MTELFRRIALVVAFFVTSSAWAGIFHLPHFVTPGDFAIGLEPELTLTSGAGVGGNVVYTHGLNDLLNLSAIVGTGSGPRQLRLGSAATVEFFPDIQGQPGIGVILKALWIKVPTYGRPEGSDDTSGQVEVTATPYLHKTVPTSSGSDLEPFVGVPFGMAFQNGQYKAVATVVIGTMIKHSEHFRSTLEFGIAVNRSDTYLSGGISYYH